MELIPSLAGRCDYVDNGLSAIKLVQQTLENVRTGNDATTSYYSLILLDYSMPKIDGPTTASRIMELYKDEKSKNGVAPPLPHTVCLTAFTEKIFEQKARESGMQEFVSKPISNAKLKQILREQRLISLSESLNDM